MSDILKIDIKILKSVDDNLNINLGELGNARLDIPPDSSWWVMHDAIKELLSLGFRYEDPIDLKHKEEIIPIKPFVKKEYSHYSVSPDLPRGLSLNDSTGEITGIPLDSILSEKFTVTADMDTFSFHLSVIEPAPTNLHYDVRKFESETDIYLKPTYSGDVDYFLIDKDLPVGIEFNETTGEIKGSTVEIVESKSYTVIAQNKFGGTSFNLVLTIQNSKPRFSYGTPYFTAQRDRLFDIYPTLLGPIDYFTVNPELPKGLEFFKKTGRIKGMVKELSEVKYKPDEFEVTAHHANLTHSEKISILRVIPAPSKLEYDSLVDLTKGLEIAPLSPTIEGDPHTIRYCAWLPEGLSIDVMTGVITGVPEDIGEYDVKVVASNSSGTVQFAIRLNIY